MPDSSDKTPKTFVYLETEVKLTGRTAKRDVGKPSRRNTTPQKQVVHEITPADSENGSWVKWVRLAELFEIE